MASIPRNRQFCLRLTLVVSLAVLAPQTESSDSVTPSSRFHIFVSGTCIDADIQDTPLRLVAQALQAQSDIQLTLNDPKTAAYSISTQFNSCSVDQSIRQLLNGLSYVVSASRRGRRVVVLSADQAGGSGFPTSSEIAPLTLDEFRRIAVDEETVDAETASTDQRQLREAMLQRALDALNSTNTNLYVDAIEQLATIEDPRATDQLIHIAQHGPNRSQATEVLGRMALQVQTADPSLVATLRQLAADPDAEVRRAAALAVEQ